MSFIKSLRKLFPFIAVGAQAAEGATGGKTQAGIGIAFDTVNEILNHPQYNGDTEKAHADAIKATALAVDDHQSDIDGLQAEVAGLKGLLESLQRNAQASPQPGAQSEQGGGGK